MKAIRTLSLVAALVVFGACVGDPVVYDVRMRPDIADVEERILSVQLLTPSTVGSECVICRGILTSAFLENSDDDVEDFGLGYVRADELRPDAVKVLLQEAGETRIFALCKPPLPLRSTTVYLSASIPRTLSSASVEWAEQPARAESGRRPERSTP